MPAPTPGSRTPSVARSEDLYGQIIPIEADAVLLPNAAVIEVRSMDDIKVRSEPPGWLLGTVRWREHELPVISLEGLLGRPMPARGRRSRLVIINSVATRLAHGLMAIVCQGYPHLTALNRSALQSTHREPRDPDALVLTRVRVANTLAIIPDLDAIESRAAEALPVLSAPIADWEPSVQ